MKKDKYLISSFKNGKLIQQKSCIMSIIEYNLTVIKIKRNKFINKVEYFDNVTKFVGKNFYILLKKV